MMKVADNPPPLYTASGEIRESDGTWWVGHVKSRFEKAFAWDLHRRGIGYYLPMLSQVRVYDGRKRRLLQPVFPSYVFFCGDGAERYEAVCTGRLCQAIEVRDQRAFVTELDAVRRVVESGAEVEAHPHAAIGRRCRVSAGPFMGVEGTVIERARQARFVVEVGMLGQGASIEIEGDLLEAVDEN